MITATVTGAGLQEQTADENSGELGRVQMTDRFQGTAVNRCIPEEDCRQCHGRQVPDRCKDAARATGTAMAVARQRIADPLVRLAVIMRWGLRGGDLQVVVAERRLGAHFIPVLMPMTVPMVMPGIVFVSGCVPGTLREFICRLSAGQYVRPSPAQSVRTGRRSRNRGDQEHNRHQEACQPCHLHACLPPQ
ncbi:hypothetical protein [Dongia mobilis]|uniref:hypothetical protein n=1 Tax=Dongia mobilis TaxID=578943 RepID=UPI00105E63E1|nr:hypothetical protein [Dongia mobilis]